ncbi:ArsR/SmtB family transcription factor [Thermococcus thioreducens]|uniref:Transcriptional regulator n=1 Tax=Thermococcus thioreducens TaxID=277988 RepID=A0A0Q2QSM4_9EURY|nr:metalloregulator ArsR/SmtB family transcription factor [Thermococcus thioreducens]ASJ12295.1 transcriptional regulator [Thermococcus thioreducens]KQH83029.1 ArsR family transcriptional regulator [Thermococcus thioreducens]SEV93359.1 transcriptional regulator, ArsR family [Thermococcus thioreducens]
MKIRDLLDELNPKQKETVIHCAETCGIPDLDREVEIRIEGDMIKFLKALSNPLRLKILKLLKDNWLCVCLISKILDQDQTLISHHLRTLKSLGLIIERKEGKMHFYRTNTEILQRYLSMINTELV